MTRDVWSLIRTGRCLTICALLTLGCKGKDGRYFVPNPFGPPIEVTDLIPPNIENVRPASDIVISERYILVDVYDGPGGSGLDPASLAVLYGTQQLPSTRLGTSNTYNFDIGAIGEGARTLNIQARDYAGNPRSRSVSFRTDWSGPSVTLNSPSTGSSTQLSAQANFSGAFGDANGPTLGTYYVRQPVNGQCSPSGALFPTGTVPGTVSQNEFQLGTGGTYNFDVTIFGPPNAPQRPVTYRLCGHAHLEDAARDVNNNRRPNQTDRTWPFDFTFAAMAPSEGEITGRVTVNGNTPLPGVTVSIPGKSAITDANGSYTFTNVPVGTVSVGISNVPADVYCSTLSKPATVTSGQNTPVDFNCLRLRLNNYTATATGTVKNDPSGHEPFLRVTNISTATVKILPNNAIEVTYGITMAGTIVRQPDGTFTFTANGSGTISGRTATGTFTGGLIEVNTDGTISKVTGVFTFGTQGQLPGGQSVSYDVTLTAPVLIP